MKLIAITAVVAFAITPAAFAQNMKSGEKDKPMAHDSTMMHSETHETGEKTMMSHHGMMHHGKMHHRMAHHPMKHHRMMKHTKTMTHTEETKEGMTPKK